MSDERSTNTQAARRGENADAELVRSLNRCDLLTEAAHLLIKAGGGRGRISDECEEMARRLQIESDLLRSSTSHRNDALEEAAKVCEAKADKPKEQTTEYAQFMLRQAAMAIRDLKDSRSATSSGKPWGADPDQSPCKTMGQCHAYAKACVEQGRLEYKDQFIAGVNELTGVLCFPDDLELFWERINRFAPDRSKS